MHTQRRNVPWPAAGMYWGQLARHESVVALSAGPTWPPGQHETRMRPTANGAERFSTCHAPGATVSCTGGAELESREKLPHIEWGSCASAPLWHAGGQPRFDCSSEQVQLYMHASLTA